MNDPFRVSLLIIKCLYDREEGESRREAAQMGQCIAGMRPTPHHFNTLLKAHYEAGNLEAMTEVYADMRASGIIPNAYTFGFLFKASAYMSLHRASDKGSPCTCWSSPLCD